MKLESLFAVDGEQRIARLYVVRTLAFCRFGPRHPVTLAVARATVDPEAIPEALAAIACLPTHTARNLGTDCLALTSPPPQRRGGRS